MCPAYPALSISCIFTQWQVRHYNIFRCDITHHVTQPHSLYQLQERSEKRKKASSVRLAARCCLTPAASSGTGGSTLVSSPTSAHSARSKYTVHTQIHCPIFVEGFLNPICVKIHLTEDCLVGTLSSCTIRSSTSRHTRTNHPRKLQRP